MTRFDFKALLRLLVLSLLAWMLAAAVCTLVGSTGSIGLPTRDIAALRLTDHVLIASLVGAALSAAGVAYQAILRNPLADPYLLGASGGATLAAYAWRLGAFNASVAVMALSPHLAAMLGSTMAVAVVLLAAGPRGRLEPTRAILVGVVVNSLCGSAFLLLNALFRDQPGSGGALTYLSGDIQTNASRLQVEVSTAIVLIGVVILLAMAPLLNVVRLSEDEALSLGVRVQRARWTGLVVGSIITASAVAVSGPIGFIGLICPHVARWLVGNDHRRLLPTSTAMGAVALCLADAIARLLSRNDSVGTLIPVGVITALAGGPFVLVILARLKR